jgi:hypothetical protein
LFDEYAGPHSTMVNDAIEELAKSGDPEERGAVFTRLEVVDFILNLAGYTEDKPLHKKRLLEPSFGGGDFLLPIVRRLLRAWRAANGSMESVLDDLGDVVQAVELHHDTFNSTKMKLVDLLKQEGLPAEAATLLANRWLLQGDFLLIPLDGQFDFVVGNPPYVRQELIPAPLLAEYRTIYRTIYDRADLYVPFNEAIEKSNGLKGRLTYYCCGLSFQAASCLPFRKDPLNRAESWIFGNSTISLTVSMWYAIL